MKKYSVAMLLLLIAPVFLLVACTQPDPMFHLAVCGSYGVPGMFCYELKGDTYSCRIIEEDAEGRTLFEYTTRSVISGKEETAYVICQKQDSEYVYFYEDNCYVFSDFDQTSIELLKEKNDWGKPLNQDNMSRRSNAVSADLYIITNTTLDNTKIRSICCDEMGIELSQITELCILDIDTYGHELYWLRFEKNGYEDGCYVLANSNYNISFLKITDNVIDPGIIASYKKEHGWIYGF